MAKYIDKFISEFDKRLDNHLNLSTKRSEEFLKVRDEQIALENGVLLSSLKPGKPKPFLGLGGWSGHKYKDLKGLYEYVFQKDGSMHLPPEKVKGKINPDYTFFNDYIIYLATYNVILNAKNRIFIQVKSYPGAPAEQDDMELLDIPEPIVERTEKIKEFKTKTDFPFGAGDKNLKIKDIQKWLGFTGKDVDGSFGNGTYNALLYGGYLIGLTASVTSVIYDELKRDYENGIVEKKPVAVVVPPKPDPYVDFLKKAETVKEKGGGRYWFDTFMDIVEKSYIKNATINDSIKKVMEYCDIVFGMGSGNVDSIPEVDIIGNRAVDIYYMKNYGSVGKEYDNYLKFYSVILSDNYINKDKGVLGVMSRDVFTNLIPCFPEPKTIAMDMTDIDVAMNVTKNNPEDESLLLYNAFLEAAEYYSQNRDVIDTIPLGENKWEVLPSAARHLLDPKWETLGDYTFEFSMEDVINVISGPSGPGSNILIPSYVGLTESSVNVGELFREYRGEIVSTELLDDSYVDDVSEIKDQNGITDEAEEDYDSLASEYLEVDTEELQANEGLVYSVGVDYLEKATIGEFDPGDISNEQSSIVNPVSISTVAKGKIKKLLEIAKGELGYRDSYHPSNNNKDSKYGAHFKMNGYNWCGLFVSWCCEYAGIGVSSKNANAKNGSIPDVIHPTTGVTIFKNKGSYVSNGSTKSERQNSSVVPEPGDIIFFSWNYGSDVNHVGIVVKDMGKDGVLTYEGNTGGGKGGRAGVFECKRSRGLIIGYGKTAKYDPSNNDPYTTPKFRTSNLYAKTMTYSDKK